MKAHEPRSAHGVVGRRCAMGRRCVLTAGKAERAELERLSRSAVRGGPGAGGAAVARRRDQRRNRGPAGGAGRAGAALARGGPLGRGRGAARRGAARRSRPRPGRTPRKREAALAVAREVLDGPAADRPVWTLARLAAEVAACTGVTVSPGHLSVVLRKGATAGAL